MQKRYHEYRGNLISYDEDTRLLGIITPGRYRGFDTLVPVTSLTFNLTHEQTGINEYDAAGNAIGKSAVICTKQGVIIRENQTIGPFAVDTNVGNTSDRYDFIVISHQYISVQGGETANYEIIKGPLNNASFPVLTDPNRQVLLGIIKVAAGAAQILGSDYERARTPDAGDEPDARLNETNQFKKFTSYSKATTTGPSFDTGFTTENVMTLNNDGNVFPIIGVGGKNLEAVRIKNTSLNEGATFTLILDNTIGINNNKVLSTEAATAGYKSFSIPQTFQDATGNLAAAGTGQKKMVEVLYVDNKLYVIYASSTNTSGGDNTVSAMLGDPSPGTLIDKVQASAYIKPSIVTTNGFSRVMFSLGNSAANFDNTWRILNMGNLPSGWDVVGNPPQWKIDWFGNIALRGVLKFTGNINVGTTLDNTLFTLQQLAQSESIRVPIAVELTFTSMAAAPLYYAAIDTSGNFRFSILNVSANTQPISSVSVHLKGIILPPNP